MYFLARALRLYGWGASKNWRCTRSHTTFEVLANFSPPVHRPALELSVDRGGVGIVYLSQKRRSELTSHQRMEVESDLCVSCQAGLVVAARQQANDYACAG
jgi:hypothetical protein